MRIQVAKEFAVAATEFVKTTETAVGNLHHLPDGGLYIFLASNTSLQAQGQFFAELFQYLNEIESAYCVELIVTY